MQDYIKAMHQMLQARTEAMLPIEAPEKPEPKPDTMQISRASIDAMTLLNVLDRHPFMHRTALRKTYLNDDSQRTAKAVEWLTKYQYAKEIKGATQSGGWEDTLP